MGILERALKYPFSEPGWGSKFVLGAMICLTAAALENIPYAGKILFFIIMLLPFGYAYAVFRNHLHGKGAGLPEWGKWGDLIQQGFFLFLIGLGYFFIPGVLYGLGQQFWQEGGFPAFLGVLFITFGVGIGLVACFLLPMAVAFYATQREFLTAAFQWRGIVERIWMVQREYFISWLASLVIFLALLYLWTQIPAVGWFLFGIGLFYFSLVLASLFGKACQEVEKV